MKRTILKTLFLLAWTLPVAAQDCPTQVLVSDYTADRVRVFNGCTGLHQRSIGGGQLDGPQALRLGPDNRLYVVSEENGRIVRYDSESLEFLDVFVETGPAGVVRPTGLAFGPDGDLFVGGFQSDNVGRFDGQNGAFEGIFATGPIDGPDAGMNFGPDGHLYVPSFENDTVHRFDGNTGNLIDAFIPPGESGLRQPRVVLFPGGNRVLVSSWGSGEVLEFDLNGTLSRSLGPVGRPTGLDIGGEGELLVSSDFNGQVSRFDLTSGQALEPFLAASTSLVTAGTYVLRLGEVQAPAQATNEQFWIVGIAPMDSTELVIEEAVYTTGGRFGNALDPDQVQRPRWGRIEIDFTACDAGELRWFADDPTFGDGGYSLIRLAPSPAQAACVADGFGNTPDLSWIIGAWFGGPDHSGEGLLIDVLDGNLAFVTWFTYSP